MELVALGFFCKYDNCIVNIFLPKFSVLKYEINEF